MRRMILALTLCLTAVCAVPVLPAPTALVIPEPQTYAMMGLGLVALGLIKHKRTNRSK